MQQQRLQTDKNLSIMDGIDTIVAILTVANYVENQEQNWKLTKLVYTMEDQLDSINSKLDKLIKEEKS